jgi:hypothetical protein
MGRCVGAAARLPEGERKDLAVQVLSRSEPVSTGRGIDGQAAIAASRRQRGNEAGFGRMPGPGRSGSIRLQDVHAAPSSPRCGEPSATHCRAAAPLAFDCPFPRKGGEWHGTTTALGGGIWKRWTRSRCSSSRLCARIRRAGLASLKQMLDRLLQSRRRGSDSL